MADEYGPQTYGDRIAEVYDEWYGDAGFLEKDASVELLAELAGDGPVLELAIGTGRLALPLAEKGLEVHGIDASEAMVAKLREKPRGDSIPVTMGDFADVPVEGVFSLVFIAFNTLFALTTQEDQVRCFANAAAHLADGGVFLVEVFVPDLARFDRNQRFQTNSVSPTEVNLDASPEAVFDIFADGESWPRWFKGIYRVDWTGPEPKGIGTTRTVKLTTMTVHEHFLEPVVIRSGAYVLPTAPGYSAEIRRETLAGFRYPDGPEWA